MQPNPPGPQNGTLFGKQVIADVMISAEVTREQGGLQHKMSGVLVKRGNWGTDTHREMPCGGEGRDWGDAPTSQGMPRTASDH